LGDAQGFAESPFVWNMGGIFWCTDVWLSSGSAGGECGLSSLDTSGMDRVGDCVRRRPLSALMEDALEDDVVDPVGDRGPIVEGVGERPPSEVSEARLEPPLVLEAEAPAASMGLLSGDTARELEKVTY
jgi:hypothetical protein